VTLCLVRRRLETHAHKHMHTHCERDECGCRGASSGGLHGRTGRSYRALYQSEIDFFCVAWSSEEEEEKEEEEEFFRNVKKEMISVFKKEMISV
jgi:hypothetical protein